MRDWCLGEVELVALAWSWHRRRRWAATCAAPRRALPLCALRQLGLILRLLGCCTLGGTRFQHQFGLRQPRQAVLAPCHLLAHHQPIGDLSLIALFAQDEQLLDLGSQLRLQLSQAFVTDRVVPGGISMHLGPVQADRPQFQHACLLRQQEHLHKELFQFGQERARDTWPAYHGQDAGCLR